MVECVKSPVYVNRLVYLVMQDHMLWSGCLGPSLEKLCDDIKRSYEWIHEKRLQTYFSVQCTFICRRQY